MAGILNKILSRWLALVVVGVALVGCAPDEPETYTEKGVGVVVGVEYIQESFSTFAKTRLDTSEGVFVLRGTHSVIIGDHVFLRSYRGGKQHVCFESFPLCRSIWGT